MTLYQVDIEHIVGTETWTNVYHVDASDTPSAITLAGQIKDLERPVHSTLVTFVGARIRLAGPGHVGTIVLYNQAGTRGVTGTLLPLFNCARVDFGNLTKRPARKYLRGTCGGSDFASFGVWSAAFVTNLTTYANGILAIAAMRDASNRALTSATALSAVAMHQLRRGNRKKPVL